MTVRRARGVTPEPVDLPTSGTLPCPKSLVVGLLPPQPIAILRVCGCLPRRADIAKPLRAHNSARGQPYGAAVRDLAATSGPALQAIENQLQPVLEFVPVVVAGLQDVFVQKLHEVGVFVHRKRLEHGLCHLPHVS